MDSRPSGPMQRVYTSKYEPTALLLVASTWPNTRRDSPARNPTTSLTRTCAPPAFVSGTSMGNGRNTGAGIAVTDALASGEKLVVASRTPINKPTTFLFIDTFISPPWNLPHVRCADN